MTSWKVGQPVITRVAIKVHPTRERGRKDKTGKDSPFHLSFPFSFFFSIFFLSLALLVVSLLQSSGMISPTLSNLKGTRLFDGGFTLRWTAVAAHHCWLPQRLCALILVARIRPKKKKKIPSRSVGSSRRIRIAWYYPKSTKNVTGIPIKILSAYVWHTIECASFYNSASFSSFIFCLHSDVVQRDIIYGHFYNLPSSWWRTHKEMDFFSLDSRWQRCFHSWHTKSICGPNLLAVADSWD